MRATKFELILNPKTASLLGIEVPPQLLAITAEAISHRLPDGSCIDIGRPSEALRRPANAARRSGLYPGGWNVRSHAAVTPPSGAV
jgi:hypothetical protein